MAEEFRKLNDKGLKEFSSWIKDGGIGLLPLHLLESTKYSTPTEYVFSTELPEFTNRYEFGKHLYLLFEKIPFIDIEGDKHFWTTLSLLWFDKICARDDDNNRKIQDVSRYLLDLKVRNFRHLIRTPWLLVNKYGEYAEFLLAPAKDDAYPLSVINEPLEQFGSRSALLRNRQIVKLFSKLYFDRRRGRLKSGLQRKVGGIPRRAGIIVRQLSLTYDLERMSESEILKILPKEFEQWAQGVSFD